MNYVNEEWLSGRRFSVYKITALNLEGQSLRHSDRIQVATCKGVGPFFHLQLNFTPSRHDSPRHVIEVNPNNMPGGVQDLFRLLDSLFDGFGPEVFKISRLDLNADVQLPLELFFRTLAVPTKRRAENHLIADKDGRTRTQFKRSLTGFYIGRSPAMLRVYDKREEMRVKGKGVSDIPDPLTRVELELRHHKCPIRLLSQISELASVEPFHDLQFFKVSSRIVNSQREARRALLEDRVSQVGMHQAIRQLNGDRHFRRDYAGLLEPMPEINEQLQRAYLEGVRRFLVAE